MGTARTPLLIFAVLAVLTPVGKMFSESLKPVVPDIGKRLVHDISENGLGIWHDIKASGNGTVGSDACGKNSGIAEEHPLPYITFHIGTEEM